MTEEEVHTEAPEPKEEEKKLEPTFEREDLGPCRVKLKIEVAAARIKEIIDGKFHDLNESVAVPGFRRGKAPRTLLERKFGKTIRDELKGDLLENSFNETMEKADLQPVGEPEINHDAAVVDENQPFRYEVTLEVMPKIDIKDYFGVEIRRKAVEVTDAEVDEAIAELREQKAEWIPVEDGGAAEGDQVIADFTLTSGGKTVDSAENTALVVGPGVSIYQVDVPEFPKAVTGHRVGQDFECEVPFPKDHAHKDLAGKTCALKGTVKSIKRKVLPELNAEFLKALDMDDIDELKKDTRKRIQRAKESDEEERLKDEILKAIVARSEFPIPDALIARAEKEAEERFAANLYLQGVPEEQIQPSLAEKKEDLRKLGVEAVRSVLALDSIAEKERIFATEEMVDERVARTAQRYGRWPHEMREYLEERGLMKSLRREIRADLVRDELLKKAKITGP